MIQVFEDAITAAEFLREHKTELIFADIQMPDINGLDLVRSLDYKPMIIFTTAHRKFAVEGFELDAIDYLLKPVSFDRFTKSVNKATEYHRYKNSAEAEDEFLYVYSEYKLIKININEIEYIESLEDYIRIHMTHFKPVLSLMPLKKVLEKLPAGKFERVHRSYVVALNKIKSLGNKKLMLSSAEIPVSDSYADIFKKLKKI